MAACVHTNNDNVNMLMFGWYNVYHEFRELKLASITNNSFADIKTAVLQCQQNSIN